MTKVRYGVCEYDNRFSRDVLLLENIHPQKEKEKSKFLNQHCSDD